MIVCMADLSEHENRDAMHRYLRVLRIKQEEYYTTYFPRRDLFTGEPIPFVSCDQYLHTDFVSKHNIKKLIKQKPDEAKEWAINWLKKRKIEKGLMYPPTQTELRSLPCPTVRYFNSVGGYSKICAELGYKIRFNDVVTFTPLPEGVKIIQDTREQKPLDFPFDLQKKALYVGDYNITGSRTYIERKSLQDFIGSFTTKRRNPLNNSKVGVERIKAELDRARGAGYYIVMVVEESINNALSFNFMPQMRFTKVVPDHVFKNLRDLLVEYTDCFQAVFVKNRYEAVQTIIKIFEAGPDIKNIDVQYHYEEGLLCGLNQKML